MRPQDIQAILAQTHKIYNQIASDFSSTRSRSWPGFNFIQDYVKDGISVLDLGCGNGRMAELFKNYRLQYLGLDDSEQLIRLAQERYADCRHLQFQVKNILEPGLADSQYDLVLLIAVLHHIPTHELRLKVLHQIYTSLKPGSYLIVSTWNLFQLKYFTQYALSWFNVKHKLKYRAWSYQDFFVPWKMTGDVKVRYAHAFTKPELRRLLKQVGFEIKTLDYQLKGRPVSRLQGHNLIAVAYKK